MPALLAYVFAARGVVVAKSLGTRRFLIGLDTLVVRYWFIVGPCESLRPASTLFGSDINLAGTVTI